MAAQASNGSERRKFPRLNAPVYFESTRFRFLRRKVTDISLGGLRIYSDEPLEVGEAISLELFLPDDGSVRCDARVAWTRALPDGDPAGFDVGLELVRFPEEARERLQAALETV